MKKQNATQTRLNTGRMGIFPTAETFSDTWFTLVSF